MDLSIRYCTSCTDSSCLSEEWMVCQIEQNVDLILTNGAGNVDSDAVAMWTSNDYQSGWNVR